MTNRKKIINIVLMILGAFLLIWGALEALLIISILTDLIGYEYIGLILVIVGAVLLAIPLIMRLIENRKGKDCGEGEIEDPETGDCIPELKEEKRLLKDVGDEVFGM